MGFLEILLLAVGVSIDAFAVSVAGGFMDRNHKLRHALAAGIVFGLFQVLFSQPLFECQPGCQEF